uniref:TSA: Wollemia nobilis Ref_Wollemi_Transcript_12391_1949 transcribed RNA sequence n=1 Tax=Wollemia nobilis TaxID=56998 RepID=A0A0C9QRZ5_9CONI
MVETFKDRASFRLTIVDGRMYIHQYNKCFQTRDVFSIWGFTQLLEYYPGLVPDLDLMFDCVDWPIVKANQYGDSNPPPPLFRYCADDSTLDIAFPDWSFWGWAEINIRPWQRLLDEIGKGMKKIKWEDRDPTAYWKGNPFVAPVRQDLLKCNVSQEKDWNARLYIQDWFKESQEGYKQSKLADQCDHRYKIYVEGSAWSVSQKNILACDSTTLILKPQYYDFFSRRLIPLEHYWPVGLDHKCESIKVAVDWANNNTGKAKAIGKAASKFMKNEVNMQNVYDYMLHLLREYSKLLRYKPSVPKGAKEVCTRSMYCTRRQRVERRFMLESMIRSPSQSGPCNLPSPATFYESLKDWEDRKAKALQQVEEMERKARGS